MNKLTSKVQELSSLNNNISLSIAIPTHRTFPENKQDIITLKNAVREAENQLTLLIHK